MYKAKSAAGQDLANIRLRSVQLSEDQVSYHLSSLKYEELSLFGKKKPVFTPEDVTRAARLVTKAINHTPKNKIVYFELDSPKGATEGVVFPSGNVLNWKFFSIQGEDFSSRSLIGIGGSNWRLIPGRGQNYHSVKNLLGSDPQENWIQAILPKKTARQPQMTREPSPQQPKRTRRAKPSRSEKKMNTAPTDPDLEKKLQFLKDLYEKNLVDEEEYNRKRKELLDTYL